jgi:hypothetical protein
MDVCAMRYQYMAHSLIFRETTPAGYRSSTPSDAG